MHPDYDAKELFEALKENDIYVRFWGSERIEQYMRITVGTREEMEAMFAFLKKYMNKLRGVSYDQYVNTWDY